MSKSRQIKKVIKGKPTIEGAGVHPRSTGTARSSSTGSDMNGLIGRSIRINRGKTPCYFV